MKHSPKLTVVAGDHLGKYGELWIGHPLRPSDIPVRPLPLSNQRQWKPKTDLRIVHDESGSPEIRERFE